VSWLQDVKISWWMILIGGLAVLSLLSPFDLLPDFVPYLGRLDDLVALVGTYWVLRRRWHVLMGRRSSTNQQRQEHAQRADNARQRQSTTAEADHAVPLTPWQILGVQPGASREEIHVAYKKLLLQYHPDRVAHLGEELQQLAHRKTLAIQEAYRSLQQH
jgi:DnaJ like chaperone protein